MKCIACNNRKCQVVNSRHMNGYQEHVINLTYFRFTMWFGGFDYYKKCVWVVRIIKIIVLIEDVDD